jgi:hypothetical protein
VSFPIQLVSGLGGAIGCDLRRTQNHLLFVEYSGNLSRLNLYLTATTVSSGNWNYEQGLSLVGRLEGVMTRLLTHHG